MSTWEERMTAKAAERQRREQDFYEETFRQQREEYEAVEKAHAEALAQDDFEAGPPCPACYEWVVWQHPSFGDWTAYWRHRWPQQDEWAWRLGIRQVCRHHCHFPVPEEHELVVFA